MSKFKAGDVIRISNIKSAVLKEQWGEGTTGRVLHSSPGGGAILAEFNGGTPRWVGVPHCDVHLVHSSVDSPQHYVQGDIECIDAIKATLGKEGFISFCRGNAMKYLWRAGLKGCAEEDIEKAQWYLNRIHNEMESR